MSGPAIVGLFVLWIVGEVVACWADAYYDPPVSPLGAKLLGRAVLLIAVFQLGGWWA